jgi:epoxyqueuosine reductase
VCVALGNTGDASDLPALERAASDSEALVAEHADWAIRQICARTASNLWKRGSVEQAAIS